MDSESEYEPSDDESNESDINISTQTSDNTDDDQPGLGSSGDMPSTSNFSPSRPKAKQNNNKRGCGHGGHCPTAPTQQNQWLDSGNDGEINNIPEFTCVANLESFHQLV